MKKIKIDLKKETFTAPTASVFTFEQNDMILTSGFRPDPDEEESSRPGLDLPPTDLH